MSLDVLTFGCRLNAVESEAMRAQAEADGLSDAVLVNTCAVTAEAVRQARQAIRRARRERPDAPILVTGCAAQTEPQTFAAMPEVTRVIGNAAKAAPGVYRLDPAAPRAAVGDIFAAPAVPAAARPLRDRVRAHVAVQTGCDHRCTFCVIPYGRGDSRSIPAGAVVSQVRDMAAQGVKEVVLTGVDLTSWGGDLPGGPPLGRLVRRILTHVPELPRLRLSSIDAAEIDDELLACFAEHERLMPYLHLSLQHGDDLILKRMKRRHLRADALRLVERVRAVRPDVAFGADLIAASRPRARRPSTTSSPSCRRRISPSSTSSRSAPARGRRRPACPSCPGPRSRPAPPFCGRRPTTPWPDTSTVASASKSRPSSRTAASPAPPTTPRSPSAASRERSSA